MMTFMNQKKTSRIFYFSKNNDNKHEAEKNNDTKVAKRKQKNSKPCKMKASS